MTVIEHDFPPDVPVSVVVDCSPPSAMNADALTLLQEGMDLVKDGDQAIGFAKMEEARVAIEAGKAERITVRPLTGEELAQRDVDQAAAARQTDADEKAAADRKALVAKLASGKATAAEMQTALAQLLGGSS